ncbi:sugar nucleotide-binding protein [Nonlabens antarcticus]|uniref:sugar nucleotide-binding protein n=1 Tax=Nonlabens antarcticus TaxID=392714 RepID=UPI001890E4F4|nr:sugar nucleotide-binding protein [Nonlabens antarcticus]
MSKTIGIMGCGWLGKPLAVSLIEKGAKVKGTTTRIEKLDDLRDAGIDPYMVDLQETFIDGGIDDFLEGLGIIVINIPPGLRANPESDYAGRIQLLVKNCNAHDSIKQLIYISTTAVFEETADIPNYNESSPANATDKKGKKLIAGEQMLNHAMASTTVIRPGGLIGGDRHPVKYLAGKKNIANPDAPINLTDREYLIDVIEKVIHGDIQQPLLHAISEKHETRRSYYDQKAAEFNLEAPEFDERKNMGKRIVSEIL